MKIKNSTDFTDPFLRRMCSWICGELGMSPRYMRSANFTKCDGAYRGRAWLGSRRILVRIGGEKRRQLRGVIFVDGVEIPRMEWRNHKTPPLRDGVEWEGEGRRYKYQIITETIAQYPMECKYPGRVNAPSETLADRIEALVHVTAHELAHHERWASGVRRNHEAGVDGVSFAVLRAFRAKREALLAEWSKAVKEREAAPKVPVWQKRADSVMVSLEKWQRKLKLAQTKVKKLKVKVRYYDNRKAACIKPEDIQ